MYGATYSASQAEVLAPAFGHNYRRDSRRVPIRIAFCGAAVVAFLITAAAMVMSGHLLADMLLEFQAERRVKK